MKPPDVPNQIEFRKGCKAFEEHEPRDAMYKVATFLIERFWRKPPDIADGLGVLLLTWNQAFYRYGMFDFEKLERCIRKHHKKLWYFRNRKINTLKDSDENDIKAIFNDFLDALQIASGKSEGKKSPVAVAKALHLLAPEFFPLWDDKIARKYSSYYGNRPDLKYISFSKKMRDLADKVKDYIPNSNKPLLKLIDEYNYARYTQGWI